MFKFMQRTANAIGVLLFALLFLVFVVQVTARFAFDKPLTWTDEAAVILYLWAILWGAALVCKDRENVAFDLFYQKASASLQRAMALASCALIGVLSAWALPGSLDYITSCGASRRRSWACPSNRCLPPSPCCWSP